MLKDHTQEMQSDTSATGSSSSEARKQYDTELTLLRARGHVIGEFGPPFNYYDRMGNSFYYAVSKLTWSGWVYAFGLQLIWKSPWSKPYFSERNGYEKPFFRLKGWRLFFYNRKAERQLCQSD